VGAASASGQRKQYLPLGDARVLDWALRAADEAADAVVLVVPADMAEAPEPPARAVVAGGPSRSASVRAGLDAIPADVDVVIVHDAARPVPVPGVWHRVLEAVEAGADAAVPAVPLSDTLREVGGTTVDRGRFVAVQTPQAFRAAALREAHAAAPEGHRRRIAGRSGGWQGVVVDGDPANIKITTPIDLSLAELLCR
jgi:2-C-methyl-D-erythritol 4-phosphate cytidylyltransferase